MDSLVIQIFRLFDLDSVLKAQVLEKLAKLGLHTSYVIHIEGNGEINPNLQIFTGFKFRNYLCPKSVPYFRWNKFRPGEAFFFESRDQVQECELPLVSVQDGLYGSDLSRNSWLPACFGAAP
jgi:hypothetical protein